MKHIYDDGSTQIIVEVHDNAPNNVKREHLRVFNNLVKLAVHSLSEKAKTDG